MSWPHIKDPKHLKEYLLKQYTKGQLASFDYPLTFKLEFPKGKQISANFKLVQQWAKLWRGEAFQDKLDFKTLSLSQYGLGEQTLPCALTFNSLAEVLTFIGKNKEYQRYLKLKAKLEKRFPKLETYTNSSHLEILEKELIWDQILEVLAFIKDNPKSHLYLRQVDLPNLDTKFIEKNFELLNKLLPFILEEQDYNAEITGKTLASFLKRYNFKLKPKLIRLRFLDPKLSQKLFQRENSDFALDLETFAHFNHAVKFVVIVENEITYLSLPKLDNTLAIFGKGYEVADLSQVTWLNEAKIAYMGDLDKDGFAILNALRTVLPQASITSLLMDLNTLKDHLKSVVKDPNVNAKELKLLNPKEKECYEALCNNTLGESLRLEQEFIPMHKLNEALFLWHGA